jgi:hypothetical protein
VEASFSKVRRNRDHHSNGFRGFAQYLHANIKISVETYEDFLIFYKCWNICAGHFGCKPHCCEVLLCCVLCALHQIYVYAYDVFVQVNRIIIIHYGQCLKAEEGWEIMHVLREGS